MRTLFEEMIRIMIPFAPLFSRRVFRHVQVLVAGAFLAPGKSSLSAALLAVSLEAERRFSRYPRVLREVPPSPAERRAHYCWDRL
jgi:hypothetical protein